MGLFIIKIYGWKYIIAYKKFISEVGQINSVEGYNQFSYKGFVEYNNDKNIRVDTSIARDEHISQGNKLGILDRLGRTLKEMIDRFRILVIKQTSFTTILEKVIITYNSQPHRTIKTTPNEMYNDIDKQNFNFEKDKEYNRNVISKNNISIGAEARILENKNKLEKGSQKYSVDLYKLVGRDGNRFIVENDEGEKLRRRLKPAELQISKLLIIK